VQSEATHLRRKHLIVIAVGTAVVILAVFSILTLLVENASHERFTPRYWVSLDETEQVAGLHSNERTSERSTLRVAIAPVVSPEKSLGIYREFVEYLAGQLDRRPVFLQRGTYAQVNDLIRYGRCDMAFVCTYPYVRGEREFGLELLAAPVVNGSATYHSVILVPGSSDVKGLLELRGKRFASADIMSNSGWLFPVTWLTERGLDANRFFGEHIITGSHDRSVLSVAAGYVDGAAVDNIVYESMLREDPSLGSSTRIVLKSPPFGMPPVVVHPKLDSQMKQQLRGLLLGMDKNPAGRAVLSSIGIERFVVPDDAAYDAVRRAAVHLEAP
jgi:phosphonate transport system substrate-binding protein